MDPEKLNRVVRKIVKSHNAEKVQKKPLVNNQKEDQMLKQLEKEIGLATSKTGNLK